MKLPATFKTLLFAVAAPLFGGCAATVVPPGDPTDPRPAYILDHGRHTTLVVVDSGGRPVRYAFGEIGNFPDGDFGFFRGMGALILPSSGTLGRRVLPGAATPSNVLSVVGVPVETLHCIAVSGELSDRLQRALNLAFEENIATARYDTEWKLQFVENPEDYWFGDTANEAVESWLMELGCEVSGTVSFANWKVEGQEAAAKVCLETK